MQHRPNRDASIGWFGWFEGHLPCISISFSYLLWDLVLTGVNGVKEKKLSECFVWNRCTEGNGRGWLLSEVEGSSFGREEKAGCSVAYLRSTGLRQDPRPLEEGSFFVPFLPTSPHIVWDVRYSYWGFTNRFICYLFGWNFWTFSKCLNKNIRACYRIVMRTPNLV